jgi:hypothetical protein
MPAARRSEAVLLPLRGPCPQSPYPATRSAVRGASGGRQTARGFLYAVAAVFGGGWRMAAAGARFQFFGRGWRWTIRPAPSTNVSMRLPNVAAPPPPAPVSTPRRAPSPRHEHLAPWLQRAMMSLHSPLSAELQAAHWRQTDLRSLCWRRCPDAALALVSDLQASRPSS